jgi:hypothetical protein
MREGSDDSRAGSMVVELIQLVFICTVLSLAAIIGTTFFHADHATTRSDTRHLSYGFPLTWVTQDQSTFVQQPDLPASTTLGSPWHNPTSTSVGRLMEDFLILGAVPATGWGLLVSGGWLIRRRKTPSPKRHLTVVA